MGTFNAQYSAISYVCESIAMISDTGTVVCRDIRAKENSNAVKLPQMNVVAFEFFNAGNFENYVIVGADTGVISIIKNMFNRCVVVAKYAAFGRVVFI